MTVEYGRPFISIRDNGRMVEVVCGDGTGQTMVIPITLHALLSLAADAAIAVRRIVSHE